MFSVTHARRDVPLVAVLMALAACSESPSNPAGGNGGLEGCLSTLNGAFLFAANDGEHGFEPWITDGTPSGTCLLIDSRPGPDGFLGDGFDGLVSARFGGTLLFDASGGIYATDGTPEGTELRFPDGRLREVVPVGDRAYVNARFPDLGGNGTYITDGTETGTQRLGSRVDLLDGLLTNFGQLVPGPSTDRLWLKADRRLRVVSTSGVDVVAEFTRDCGTRGDLTVFNGDLYLSAAHDPDGTLGGDPRCQLWRLGPTGHWEEHRRFALGGTEQVSGLSFAERGGWLYYTLSLVAGGGRALRTTNGGIPHFDPGESEDLNDFAVDLPGVHHVLQLIQRAPGSAIYAVVIATGGTDRSLVRLDGGAGDLTATLVDTQVSDWTFRTGEDGDGAGWVGNRLFYIATHGGGLRALTDGASDPVTLISGDNFRTFYQILPDPDHNRVFVWTRQDFETPRSLELWVSGGTAGPTRMVGVFCSDGGDCD
jgi:ELWxxDGT repeat protein